jgi:hypothetical protein
MKAIGIILTVLIFIVGWFLPMILFILSIEAIGGKFPNLSMFWVTIYWNIITFLSCGFLSIKFYDWFKSNIKTK